MSAVHRRSISSWPVSPRPSHRLALTACVLAVSIVFATCALGGCAAPETTAAPKPAAVTTVPARAPLTAVTLAESSAKDSYPVPAVATTRDGTIVVAYDDRHGNPRDLPNNIDIVTRRSPDNGISWTPQTVIVRHTGGNTPNTAGGVGDPSLLPDHITGRLWLFYDWAPPGVGIFTSTTSTSPASVTTVHPMVRYSDDDGATWSTPVDLIGQLKRPNMTGIFASSGHGFQTTNGTLLQPYSYFIGGIERAAVAYSTDHGRTWHMSQEIGEHLSESKIVELSDGTLLDDARPNSPGYRKFSHTTCITCRWSTPAAQTAIPDPVVNGDLIRVENHPTWLLESNPDSQRLRARLTVRLSTDNGKTWRYSLPITGGPSSYSVLTEMPDGDYAIVYYGQRELVFQRFALDQLTGPLPVKPKTA